MNKIEHSAAMAATAQSSVDNIDESLTLIGGDAKQNYSNFSDDEDSTDFNTRAKSVLKFIFVFGLLVLFLSAVAILGVWFFIRVVSSPVTVKPSTVASVSSQIRYKTATANTLRDYEQIYVPSTKAVLFGIYSFTMVTIFTALSITIFAGSIFYKPLMRRIVSLRAIFDYQIVLVVTSMQVLCTLGAVLLPLALPSAFVQDNVALQVSGGSITCVGGSELDCSSFWTSNDHVVGKLNYHEMHRPDVAWWLMIVAFGVSVAALKYVYENSGAFSRSALHSMVTRDSFSDVATQVQPAVIAV